MKPFFIIFNILFFFTGVFSQQPDPQEKVYESFDIQKMASFPGGEVPLNKFFADSLSYSKAAWEQNLSGTVALSFVVEKDGSLTDFKIVKDAGGGLADIAIKALRHSPKWIPAEANGNPVRIRFTLPVRFILGLVNVEQATPVAVKKQSGSAKPAKSVVDTKKAYELYDINTRPEYPGGFDALKKLLSENLKYTPEARSKTRERPICEFIIEKDGTVTNAKIISDPGFGLGEEALRVISLMPKWTPAKVNGTAVSVRYKLAMN